MNLRQMLPLALLCALSGCASFGGGGTGGQSDPLRKATIEVYRDAYKACKTNTTPYFALKKNTGRKLTWEIDDRTTCLAQGAEIEVKFKSGETDLLPQCVKKGNRNQKKIYCNMDHAIVGTSSYAVWLGGVETEDPVLQIEQ